MARTKKVDVPVIDLTTTVEDLKAHVDYTPITPQAGETLPDFSMRYLTNVLSNAGENTKLDLAGFNKALVDLGPEIQEVWQAHVTKVSQGGRA